MSEIDIDAPPNARALIVMVQGHDASKDWSFFPWLGEYLCDAGSVAVRFSLSSEEYAAQVHEVFGVVDRARSRFRQLPLFLFGHSLGGAIAIVAAREIHNVTGVITWSAISHDNVLDAAAQLRVPLLAVHGAKDETVPIDDARAITGKAPDSSLLIVNASHTFNAIDPLVYIPRELEYAAAVSAHFVTAYS